MKHILWLPSWYPNKTGPFDGDFIRRHAVAAAEFNPVYVVFVIKDNRLPAGASPVVVRLSTGNLHETIVYLPPLRSRIKWLNRLLSSLHYIGMSRKMLKEHVKSYGLPSLVHVHVVLRAGFTALWARKKMAIPFLLTEHWTGYDPSATDNIYTKFYLLRYLTKKVITQALMVLPVSNNLGQLICTHFGPTPYTVVPNAVDTTHFTLPPAESAVFRFIHVSTMSFQKNCEGILHSFAAVLREHPAVELVMVGPFTDALCRLTDRLKATENVHWKGEISYEEVASTMQQAGCLVMFSRFENLPCVILEALCCGLPVISTRVGGIPEVIDTANGILISQGHEPQLTAAMLHMIRDYSQYDRNHISKAAREKFNYDVVGRKITAAYAACTG